MREGQSHEFEFCLFFLPYPSRYNVRSCLDVLHVSFHRSSSKLRVSSESHKLPWLCKRALDAQPSSNPPRQSALLPTMVPNSPLLSCETARSTIGLQSQSPKSPQPSQTPPNLDHPYPTPSLATFRTGLAQRIPLAGALWKF